MDFDFIAIVPQKLINFLAYHGS